MKSRPLHLSPIQPSLLAIVSDTINVINGENVYGLHRDRRYDIPGPSTTDLLSIFSLRVSLSVTVTLFIIIQVGVCRCRGWYVGDGVTHCGPPEEMPSHHQSVANPETAGEEDEGVHYRISNQSIIYTVINTFKKRNL